jgi:Short C-terminal domain
VRKVGAQDVPEALSIDDVTCAVCRAVAGDFGGPPKSPFILTGRCPKCSRPVVWYKQKDKTPVHTATGKFECPAGADSEKGAPVAAGSGSQEGTEVAAELERLAALHSSGALDDEEFRAAKARIIHGG